jgi:hypothetical protein
VRKLFVIAIMVTLFTTHCGGDRGGSSSKITDPGKKQRETPEVPVKEKPPNAFKISSVLYDLAVAPDREQFAAEQGIVISGEMVKVFLFFSGDASDREREKIIERYHVDIEKRADNVFRAEVPIDDLLGLSKEPLIRSIDLPDKPAVP